MSRCFWHFRRQTKKHADSMAALLVSIFLAYEGLYGKEVVSEAELNELSTADARKIDLFYNGMLQFLSIVEDD